MKQQLLLFLSFIFVYGCSSSSDSNNNTNTITDIDGNTYQTVQICDQTWTKSNLNVTHYRNGDVIPQVTDNTEWAELTSGAWCYYQNNTANGPIYGKLYNWYAVNDPRGLAPLGYHIPSDNEWITLIDCLGGELIAGGKMKSTGTIQSGTGLWQEPNTSATNASFFTGLPAGFRGNDGTLGDIGIFDSIGSNGNWWSSSEQSTTLARFSYLFFDIGTVGRFVNGKSFGFSVRCIKD